MMENARIAAASMKANSIAWLTADPKTERPALVAENEQLGYAAGMTKVNGAWYMPNGERAYKLTEAEYTQPLLARIAVDVAKLAMVQDEAERKRIQDEIEYFKKTLADMKAMEKFHTGGFVGDYKSLKQNEVMAVLQKGEAVLDKQKENALYKLVDFAALLQKKLGTSIDTGLLGMLTRAATPSMPTATAYAANAAGGMNFAPTITVEINHSGSLSEADARRYGDIAADAALDKLSDAFGRRGITSFGGALLKGAQA